MTGSDNHCRFRYILENHTDKDYRINTGELPSRLYFMKRAALLVPEVAR
jgi:hypothetical protein